MSDEELHRTSILLTESHRETLDAEAIASRTEVIRDLIDSLQAARDGRIDASHAPGICPVCGRTADAAIAGSVVDVRALDDETLSVCEERGAATWLYIHRLDCD